MKIILMVLLLMIDQWTKHVAVKHLKYKGLKKYGPLKLCYVENPGAALGLFKHHPVFLKVISVLIMLVALVYMYFETNVGTQWSLAIIIGGGFGNIIDRLKKGYVVDFFSVEIKKMPYFNMADMFVLFGCVSIILTELNV